MNAYSRGSEGKESRDASEGFERKRGRLVRNFTARGEGQEEERKEKQGARVLWGGRKGEKGWRGR